MLTTSIDTSGDVGFVVLPDSSPLYGAKGEALTKVPPGRYKKYLKQWAEEPKDSPYYRGDVPEELYSVVRAMSKEPGWKSNKTMQTAGKNPGLTSLLGLLAAPGGFLAGTAIGNAAGGQQGAGMGGMAGLGAGTAVLFMLVNKARKDQLARQDALRSLVSDPKMRDALVERASVTPSK